MIAFATFFLGLVTGLVCVEVVPGEGAARVELYLDEAPVGVLTGKPWSVNVDFGRYPEPHLLVAIARDSQGRETGRARRSINQYQAMADASLVLAQGSGGKGRTATLSWESFVAADPIDVRLSFDGAPLLNQAPSRIVLPDFVPEQVHFLRVELDFPEKVTASAEIAFGGWQMDETQTELTAVLVSISKKAGLPSPQTMDGWFADGGRPLRVVSAEEGPAEIVAVVDAGAWTSLHDIAQERKIWHLGYYPPVRLLKGQQLRNMGPVPKRRLYGQRSYGIYPESQVPMPLGEFLFFSKPVYPASAENQQLRDALAVAGMSAARNQGRRAVILLAGPAPLDRSDLTSEGLGHYLKSISVPLFVIALDKNSKENAAAFGGTQLDGSGFWKLVHAFDAVAKAVDGQRVFWLEGKHLPQRIEISPLAHGIARVN
jgi:hypothetical protein